MRNDETWRFAQEYWGRLSWRYGWVLFALSVIVASSLIALSVKNCEAYLGPWIGIQAILTFGTVLPVERALKNTFDELGHRKTM